MSLGTVIQSTKGLTISDGIRLLIELLSAPQSLFMITVNLVWRSPWSVVKALFLINRYYTFLGAVVIGYGGRYLDFGPNLSAKM
ncbi:hypothetical protein JR316_0008963 [Psilocybe cubensis]|uniref:Uncharacterized protein n=1 Tax=Psilocybe cubensis TaxID=181762 RepID=A0ACB8GS93_PSICU|nr:hypothetical protein JR316_0008963 [Psilocybe cubensis]KAH9478508.1 hypothetical protein JR316_0008963 [Psilocybe cubensis]